MSDSHWGVSARDRKSISGGVFMFGSHCIIIWNSISEKSLFSWIAATKAFFEGTHWGTHHREILRQHLVGCPLVYFDVSYFVFICMTKRIDSSDRNTRSDVGDLSNTHMCTAHSYVRVSPDIFRRILRDARYQYKGGSRVWRISIYA